jgi:hypothetical protein
MARSFGQNQPVLLENDEGIPESATRATRPSRAESRFAVFALLAAGLTALFWIGVWAAFLWGYLGPVGLAGLSLQAGALIVAAMALPPVLFFAVALLLARSAKTDDAARALLAATDLLFEADETAAHSAGRLARAVRRELGGLNSGLEVAFQRMRTLETVLENQIATLDEAGARAEVRSETIAARLKQESQRLESLGDGLNEAAGKAGETVAGRLAQLKAMMETAEGTLKMAVQNLDIQAAAFRAAVTQAAEAPQAVAEELDRRAARIEQASDAVMSRAEFVLARQEKQRAGIGELLAVLEQDAGQFETALTQQRAGMEQAISALSAEARRFETVTGDAERHLERIMANAASRAAQLTGAFGREADRLKETGEAASAVLAGLSGTLQESAQGAQTLIAESSAQAKQDARLLVGEAMAECERLLRAAGEMSAESGKIRALLAKATEDVERHLIRLPGLAQEEARRVRQMIASETEQMLDLSARTLSTLHARTSPRADPAPEAATPLRAGPEPESDGLKNLARKLTSRQLTGRKAARRDNGGESKSWEMKTLLAAAESGAPPLNPARAAALGALELALADMAIDLSGLDESQPGDEDWKRYLSGDRAVFARRLAAAIDETAVDRITRLYRDDEKFHDAADAYLGEFETLLARAREGDGGGLLASTLLSADTGKVYLAIAYALGRL